MEKYYMEFDENEYKRWLEQAKYTLKAAENDHKGGFYSWSCFKSQQAAEYSLKALLLGIGEIATGHSLMKLCENLLDADFNCSKIEDFSRKLDKFYIPTRYPDAFPDGSPSKYYGKNDDSFLTVSNGLPFEDMERKIQKRPWVMQKR